MVQRLHGLSCHPDVTRFEIEDGLVRDATATLLSEATTISSVIVDLGIHPRTVVDSGDRVDSGDLDLSLIAGYNATMLITGEDDEAALPPNLADLVSEVAVVGSSWLVTTTEVAELDKPWIGAATPGPKLSAFFSPAAAADSLEYRTAIAELAAEICAGIGDVGCRISHIEDGPAPFTTAMSFWFSSPLRAEDAVRANRFDGLMSSGLTSTDSMLFVESIEHRVVPNPNIWATTTGVEPPADG